MGTTLTGTQINNTYSGLLKTTDNAAIGAGVKTITDGAGNDTPLGLSSTVVSASGSGASFNVTTGSAQIASNGISIQNAGLTDGMYVTGTGVAFGGAVDFSGSTVTGLPGGAAGLENGTGTDSLQSAASLTTTPADATTTGSIALGNDAIITPNASRPSWTALGHIAIGNNATVLESSFGDFYTTSCIAIGQNTSVNPSYDGGSIAIGHGANTTKMHGVSIGANATTNQFSIAMGQSAQGSGSETVAIGRNSFARATYAVTVGSSAVTDDTLRVNTVVVGANAKSAQYSTALGYGAYAVGAEAVCISDGNAAGNGAIALGFNAVANQNYCMSLGYNSEATTQYGVAIGYQVTNTWSAATTVNQLQIENYASLNYADDTAAAAGGVALGGVYHNSGALRIRIV
jgi:hypothetical protein